MVLGMDTTIYVYDVITAAAVSRDRPQRNDLGTIVCFSRSVITGDVIGNVVNIWYCTAIAQQRHSFVPNKGSSKSATEIFRLQADHKKNS